MKNNHRSPKDVDVYAGERLRVRRKQLGFSQKTLAEYVGITFQQIQKYEKGLNRIGVSRLYEFCRLLKVKPSYFFENMDYEGNDTNSQKIFEMEEDTNQVFELVKAFKSIKDEQKRLLILDLVKSYNKN